MIMHYSSAQKKPPSSPRREAAGGRVRRRLVYSHWLHPDQLGGGPDTDQPSIDQSIAKKVALSNDSPASWSSPDQTTALWDQAL